MPTKTYNCPSCDSEHDIEYTEGSDAPQCFNHDSSLFSNDGSPDEITDYPTSCSDCGNKFELRAIEEKIFS